MFTPTSPSKPVPALASGAPQISSDGKTVTVHIKPDYKWSPPLNRAITSKDVAFAFQRDFNSNVQNGYASGYYPIVGAAKAAGKPISGISTPNDTTIVFHLTKDFGATFAAALTLPGSAPVPESLGTTDDKSSPSKYDSDPTQQAFSGPYMIQKYNAGRNVTLIRNPNWSKSVDGVRPAYSDKIVWNAGADATVAAHQTLDSTDLLMADGPPAAVLKSAYETKKTQLSIAPLGMYYAALNTQVPPFNNINLRKAVIAASEPRCVSAGSRRQARRLGRHPLHPSRGAWLPAGGRRSGLRTSTTSPHPAGDMTVAEKYMKAAGYPSGKYTGSANVMKVVGAQHRLRGRQEMPRRSSRTAP